MRLPWNAIDGDWFLCPGEKRHCVDAIMSAARACAKEWAGVSGCLNPIIIDAPVANVFDAFHH